MPQPFLNDASFLVSLLIENSSGTFEVILRRMEFDGEAGFAPVQLIPLSGASPSMQTHLSGECNVDAEVDGRASGCFFTRPDIIWITSETSGLYAAKIRPNGEDEAG